MCHHHLLLWILTFSLFSTLSSKVKIVKKLLVFLYISDNFGLSHPHYISCLCKLLLGWKFDTDRIPERLKNCFSGHMSSSSIFLHAVAVSGRRFWSIWSRFWSPELWGGQSFFSAFFSRSPQDGPKERLDLSFGTPEKKNLTFWHAKLVSNPFSFASKFCFVRHHNLFLCLSAFSLVLKNVRRG